MWAPEWVDPGEDLGFVGLPMCAAAPTPTWSATRAPPAPGGGQTRRAAAHQRHGLAMKISASTTSTRRRRPTALVVYFTAPHRVDFRSLVGELARSLDSRVDLRQVGSRDAARLTGGIGRCGRDLCCATFLKDFEPVSLRMAKAQDLPPNPLRISGACGRLLCCLKYEHPLYADFARDVPGVGGASRSTGRRAPSSPTRCRPTRCSCG